MAVAIDNTGKSAGSTSTTSITIGTFAVGAGANRCIYLAVSQYKASDLQPTAAFDPTGANQAFTAFDSITIAESPGTRRITLFHLVNPANVTGSIVVTWSSAVDEAVCGATSWTGVDQTTPLVLLGTTPKSSGTSGTSSSVSGTVATGDVAHSAISVDAQAAAEVTANQTQRWRQLAAANTTEGAGQTAAGAGASITLTWSTFFGGAVFAHIGVAITQASGGGGTFGRLVGGTLCGGLLTGGLLSQ